MLLVSKWNCGEKFEKLSDNILHIAPPYPGRTNIQ